MILVKTPFNIGYAAKFGLANWNNKFYLTVTFFDGSTFGITECNNAQDAKIDLEIVQKEIEAGIKQFTFRECVLL